MNVYHHVLWHFSRVEIPLPRRTQRSFPKDKGPISHGKQREMPAKGHYDFLFTIKGTFCLINWTSRCQVALEREVYDYEI